MSEIDNSRESNRADALDALFAQVPVRQRPPAEHEALVRQAVKQQWNSMTRHRRAARSHLAWAAAASIALAVAALIQFRQADDTAIDHAPIATVDRIVGAAERTGLQAGAAATLHSGAGLRPGASLITRAGGGVALRWGKHGWIRVDQNSRIDLLSASELRLVDGRIYVDTGPARTTTPGILTPQGVARHHGTQYQVQIEPGRTGILVREGAVEFTSKARSAKEPARAVAGQALAVTDSGDSSIEPSSTWGDAWRWAESLAPAYAADGRTLAELLDWVARETGHELEYESESARLEAKLTRMHGSLDLPPDRALTVAVATTDLRVRMESGRIYVSAPD